MRTHADVEDRWQPVPASGPLAASGRPAGDGQGEGSLAPPEGPGGPAEAPSASLLTRCVHEQAEGPKAAARGSRLLAVGLVAAQQAESCAAWMQTYLADYAHPLVEVVNAGVAAGFSHQDVQEARVLLTDKGLRDGLTRTSPRWWCGFGSPRDWVPRPER